MTSRATIAALGVCTLAIAGCTDPDLVPAPPPSDEVQDIRDIQFLDTRRIVIHSPVVLSDQAREAFQQFINGAPAYAAFYVRPDGRGWGSQRGGFSLAEVREVARTRCDIFTGFNCELFATIQTIEPATPEALPVALRQSIQRGARGGSLGPYMAVARNKLGRYGTAWRYQTRAEAEENALRFCTPENQVTRSPSNDRATNAFVDAGYYECEIFVTYGAQ